MSSSSESRERPLLLRPEELVGDGVGLYLMPDLCTRLVPRDEAGEF